MLGLSLIGWAAGFAILRQLGTWTPFALIGPGLVALSLASDAAARALLRPSARPLGLGLAAGLVMVLLTHAAFATVAPILPGARDATARLFDLLNVGGFSAPTRTALIVVIATSEEILFRGSLIDDRRRVLASAAAYAAAMAPLGSGLLLACGFGCAMIWGALRVGTRSLIAPIAAHVVWDLGVLVVWPLRRLGGP
jgi:membrane protease YdiL (CAAX protease family)